MRPLKNKYSNSWESTLAGSKKLRHGIWPLYVPAIMGTGKRQGTVAYRGAQARMICIASSFGLGPETRGEIIGWVMPA